MSEMSVEFSFDEQKLKQRGKSKANLYNTLKENFAEKGLVCTADGGNMLVFSGTGENSDYGRMWALIMKCIECDWITDYLTRFVWVEDNREEDILAQIPKAKRRLAAARAIA